MKPKVKLFLILITIVIVIGCIYLIYSSQSTQQKIIDYQKKQIVKPIDVQIAKDLNINKTPEIDVEKIETDIKKLNFEINLLLEILREREEERQIFNNEDIQMRIQELQRERANLQNQLIRPNQRVNIIPEIINNIQPRGDQIGERVNIQPRGAQIGERVNIQPRGDQIAERVNFQPENIINFQAQGDPIVQVLPFFIDFKFAESILRDIPEFLDIFRPNIFRPNDAINLQLLRNLIPFLNVLEVSIGDDRFMLDDRFIEVLNQRFSLNNLINRNIIQRDDFIKTLLNALSMQIFNNGINIFNLRNYFRNKDYFKYAIQLIPQNKIRQFLYSADAQEDDQLQRIQANVQVHNDDNVRFNECIIKALRAYKVDNYPYTLQQILDKAIEIEQATQQFATQSAIDERLQPGTFAFNNRVNQLTLSQNDFLRCSGSWNNAELVSQWGFGDLWMGGDADRAPIDQKIFICELAVRVWDIIQEIADDAEKRNLIGNFISTIKNEIIEVGGVCSTGWANRLTHIIDILNDENKALFGITDCYSTDSVLSKIFLQEESGEDGFSFNSFYNKLIQEQLYGDIDDFDEIYYAGTKQSFERYDQDILYGYLVIAFIKAFQAYFYKYFNGDREENIPELGNFNDDFKKPLINKFKKEFMNAFRKYRMEQFNKLAPGVCDLTELEDQIVLNKFRAFDNYQYNKNLNTLLNPDQQVEENTQEVLNLIQNNREAFYYSIYNRKRVFKNKRQKYSSNYTQYHKNLKN